MSRVMFEATEETRRVELSGAIIDQRAYHSICDARDELCSFFNGGEADWRSLGDTSVSLSELERRWSDMIRRMASVGQIDFCYAGKCIRVRDEEQYEGTRIGEEVVCLSLSDLRQFYFEEATSEESCMHDICQYLGVAECIENLKGLMLHAFDDKEGRVKKSPEATSGPLVREELDCARALWLYCNIQTIILIAYLVGCEDTQREAVVVLARCRRRILEVCVGKVDDKERTLDQVYVVA